MSDHDWQSCDKEDCQDCTELIEMDFLMACDGCGFVGLKETNAAGNVKTTWTMHEDGTVLCLGCENNQPPTPE